MKASVPLFVVGYPLAVGVITRWVPVVRERRTAWFAVHTAAVGAIVTGWAVERQWSSVAVNGTWLVASVIWYVVDPAHRRTGRPSVSRRRRL